MGGGNAQKSATARARKQAELAKGSKGSQLKQNAAAQNVTCQICRQTFLCTATQVKLQEHVDSKHEKQGFQACFPSFVKA